MWLWRTLLAKERLLCVELRELILSQVSFATNVPRDHVAFFVFSLSALKSFVVEAVRELQCMEAGTGTFLCPVVMGSTRWSVSRLPCWWRSWWQLAIYFSQLVSLGSGDSEKPAAVLACLLEVVREGRW